MIDVIEFLFQGFISKQIDQSITIEQIAQELPNAGFEAYEIDYAIDWLNHTLHNQDIDRHLLNQCDSFRVYDSVEMQKLNEEARGVICFLEQNNMITPSVRELIIDRAMALHINYVGKTELQWVLLFVMMNSNVRHDIVTWIEKSITDLSKLNNSPLTSAEA